MFKVYEPHAQCEQKYLRLVEERSGVILKGVDADGDGLHCCNILTIKESGIYVHYSCEVPGIKTGTEGTPILLTDGGVEIDIEKAREALRENEKLKAEIAELRKIGGPLPEGTIEAVPISKFPDKCDCKYFSRSTADHCLAYAKDKLYVQWGKGYVTKDIDGDVGRDLAIAILKNSK